MFRRGDMKLSRRAHTLVHRLGSPPAGMTIRLYYDISKSQDPILAVPKSCVVKNRLTHRMRRMYHIRSQSSFILFQNQTSFLPSAPSTVLPLPGVAPPAPRCPCRTLVTLGPSFHIHSQHPGAGTFLPPVGWDNGVSQVFSSHRCRALSPWLSPVPALAGLYAS